MESILVKKRVVFLNEKKRPKKLFFYLEKVLFLLKSCNILLEIASELRHFNKLSAGEAQFDKIKKL